MRVPLLLLLPLLFVISAANADDEQYYGSYRFKPGSTQTVFSDTAYIRSSASGSAAAIDSLYAFQTLKIVKMMQETLSLGRKSAPWYQVSFQRNGSARLGYLWGGAMALKSAKHMGVDFAASVLSYPDPAAFTGDVENKDLQYFNTFSIKAKSATARDEARFNISRESQYCYEEMDSNGVVTDKHWLPSKGLPPGASFIIRFGMSGEACGIPTYEIMAAWNGTNLIRLPMKESNADGGEWAYFEEFVFPSQKGGKPGELRVKATSESAIENSDKMKTEVSWKSYRYDAGKSEFILVR